MTVTDALDERGTLDEDRVPFSDLGKKVVQGSAMQFASKFLLRGLKFIRTLILAKLLFPEDFGLFVLASVCMGFVETFVQSGFQAAIIQRDSVERKHLDGAWTLHILKGFILGSTMFLCAPLMAHFFNEPQLTIIIRVLSIILFIEGFSNIGIVMLQKEFQFGKKLLYDFSFNIIEMIVVTIGAFLFSNVWALVVGAIAGRFAAVVLSYYFHPYRPRLTLHFEGAKELFRFGRWVWFGGVLTFFISRGDGVAIGKILSVEDLGYYQLAFSLALLPALEIVRSLGGVFFPLFARLKDNEYKLVESFTRSSQMMMCVIMPVSTGIFLLAEPMVRLLYGARWLPMVGVLRLLVVYGLFKSIEYVLTPVLLGVGKPRILTISMIVHGALLFLTLVPFTHMYGIEGTALSLLCAAVFSSLFLGTISFYMIPTLSFLHVRSILSIPLVGSIALYGSLVMLMSVFPVTSLWLLGGVVMAGGVVYMVVTFICDSISGQEIRNSIMWVRHVLK